MKRKKQNKHLDPFFRAKIRSKSNRHQSIGQSWIAFCKQCNISLPKQGLEDLRGVYL